ncbi:hypothetical protein AVEN_250301-1 [Araneus ventricosus]|uniref:Uncharacterized protein n=1 Tax=Araneus ventricosus TaxID=182803 RepID=A0A4Y2FKJ0_ARAVE|nr:hypothetical protein AVEN_250301-1 [Araneus ventricosus]
MPKLRKKRQQSILLPEFLEKHILFFKVVCQLYIGNVYVGQLLKRLVTGCVDNDVFHGSLSKNPFNFKHFNLNFIGLYVDGQSVPYNPLEPKFYQDNNIRAYQSLFLGTEKSGQDLGIFISRKEYPKGHTLYAFDLSPDLCDAEHLNLIKHGNLHLKMNFSKPLDQTIHRILSRDKHTSKFYKGVYPSDEIPILRKKSIVVANIDSSSEPGSHWIAFYKEKDEKLEFSTPMDNLQNFMERIFLNMHQLFLSFCGILKRFKVQHQMCAELTVFILL